MGELSKEGKKKYLNNRYFTALFNVKRVHGMKGA